MTPETYDEKIIGILERRHPGARFRPCYRIPGFYISDMGDPFTTRLPGQSSKETESFIEDGIYLRRCWISTTNGYQSITTPSRRAPFYVHVLVLEAFIGPCPLGMEACHDPDPTRTNNRLENLRWDTHWNNCRDMEKHGHVLNGIRNPGSKLKEDDIQKIAEQVEMGMTCSQIARDLGVSRTTIRQVVSGERWGHLGLKINPDMIKKTSRLGELNQNAKLNEADIHEIFALSKTDKSYSEIGHKFGIDKVHIYRILKGKLWGHMGLAKSTTHSNG